MLACWREAESMCMMADTELLERFYNEWGDLSNFPIYNEKDLDDNDNNIVWARYGNTYDVETGEIESPTGPISNSDKHPTACPFAL